MLGEDHVIKQTDFVSCQFVSFAHTRVMMEQGKVGGVPYLKIAPDHDLTLEDHQGRPI